MSDNTSEDVLRFGHDALLDVHLRYALSAGVHALQKPADSHCATALHVQANRVGLLGFPDLVLEIGVVHRHEVLDLRPILVEEQLLELLRALALGEGIPPDV